MTTYFELFFFIYSLETYHRYHPGRYNQFEHHYIEKEGILGGHVTKDIRLVPQKEDQSHAQASTSTQGSTSSKRQGQKPKNKKKKKLQKRRRRKNKTDKKEKAPAGIGPQLSSSTMKAKKSKADYEMKTLKVGSLAANICKCLLRDWDQIRYPFGTEEYFQYFKQQRAIAKGIALHIQKCVESEQLMQKAVYEMIMIAVDDIKDPSRLAKQSLEMRELKEDPEDDPMSSSSSARPPKHRDRERWDLPEEYDDDFARNILDQTVIYALATFIFQGSNTTSSVDQRIQRATKSDEKPQLRIATRSKDNKDRTDDTKEEQKQNNIPFYARWVFERYQHETKFVPLKDRDGVQTFGMEATRSALAPVLQALEAHYKCAVVSLSVQICLCLCGSCPLYH